MSRNYLKGIGGDSMNALLSGIGFNFRLLLREVAFFGWYFLFRSVSKPLGISPRKFRLGRAMESY